MFGVEFLAAVLAVVGLLILFSSLSSRGKRLDGAESGRPPSIADEAERWLKHRKN